MSDQYYLIKDKKHPEGMGLTVRVKGRNIENLTGDNNKLKKFDFNIGDTGIFASQNCLVFEITEKEADDNVKNYESWIMLQSYVSTDTISPTSVSGMGVFK